MSMTKDKSIISDLLAQAGITINGDKPYDPQIHDESFYGRVLKGGSLALGESYMDGVWECERLDEFFSKLLLSDIESRVKNPRIILSIIRSLIFNNGSKSSAFKTGDRHYDIGNELYKAMLDKRLAYTCGYWKDAENLDDAQEAKLDLVCRKISLKPGETVLDIGSGWGSFMGYAAEKYGVIAKGVTVSKEQKALADELYGHLPVQTELKDYRDIDGQHDHVVSLGMFEHVGVSHHRKFMEIAHNSLKDDGLFLLHTIGGNNSSRKPEPWIEKYIFPQGMIPSAKQIARAAENLFVIEDWHNFSADYDKTLMAWNENFQASWPYLQAAYGERFRRMWTYYLLSCAGAFRARKIQLWQIVFSKKGVPGGYHSVR